LKTVLELGESARALLAPGSERGNDGTFYVGEHRVDDLECRVTSGLAAGAGDNRLACATRVSDAIEAAEPVGDDPRVKIQPVIFLIFFFVNRRTRRSFTRCALPPSLDSTAATNGVLAGAAASALTAAALPAEIGFVLTRAAVRGGVVIHLTSGFALIAITSRLAFGRGQGSRCQGCHV
jgi:hypothetical protein